ncbi:MAG: hypothetical protein ACYC25_11105, partial [Paludibacter sp.]
FNPETFNYSISGNIQNNGTITATSNGTTTLNGSNSQIIAGTGTTAFNNLAVTNTSAEGVLLNKDVTTTGLNIASGSLLTISPAVKMNVTGSITNDAGTSGLIIKSDPN